MTEKWDHKEYTGWTSYQLGDRVIMKDDIKDLENATFYVIQRIRPGRNCRYYYTIYPEEALMAGRKKFMSITDYSEKYWQRITPEFKVLNAEYFI